MNETDSGAGASRPSLYDMINVLQQTGIFLDILRFGMNTILFHDENIALEARLLSLRRKFQTDYGIKLADSVELYDQNRYLYF